MQVYIIVNFKTHEINRCVRKLISLIKKIKIKIEFHITKTVINY